MSYLGAFQCACLPRFWVCLFPSPTAEGELDGLFFPRQEEKRTLLPAIREE